MRHGKKFKQLSRKAPHRKALLSNMTIELILKKRIFTTLAKGKELRKYAEPILTKAKKDTTHSRRVVFSKLQNKQAVQELFDEVAQKIADRPGGYLRIIKLGTRRGDGAETCMVELVDYNELMLQEDSKGTRRGRRRRKRSGDTESSEREEPVTFKPEVEEVPETESATEEAEEETSEDEPEASTEETKEAPASAETEEKTEEEDEDEKKDDNV